jgi:putative membrane protein
MHTDINVIKALHIIFVVSWFAGLFYIVRLFIYAQEAKDMEEPKKSILVDQFVIMQKKLWWIITTPAMVLSVIFGIWMLYLNPAYLKMPWMHIKLAFVVFLLAYHFYCQKIMFDIVKGLCKWKSNQLRLWNELATLFLVAIVFLVVLKSSINWVYGTLGFFGVALSLMIAIQIYKKIRSKNNKQ